MKLRVLGSAGAEFPNFHPPAFLLDDTILLDAGTIGAVLTEDEQQALRYIFVTHSHLDHVKGIPLLADNIIVKGLDHSVTVASINDNIQAIRSHLLNNIIWPDFSAIPSVESAVIRYLVIEPEQEIICDGYAVTAYPVTHSVPAVGYIVRKGGKSLLYTGDTGPTQRIWEFASDLSAMIVEVSFPNDMEKMAILTGHLTAKLLAVELEKIRKLPERILITHPKPQYYSRILEELDNLGMPQIELLRDGNIYDL